MIYLNKGMGVFKKWCIQEADILQPDLITYMRVLELCRECEEYHFAIDFSYYHIFQSHMMVLDDRLCSTLVTILQRVGELNGALDLFDLFLQSKEFIGNTDKIDSETLNIYLNLTERMGEMNRLKSFMSNYKRIMGGKEDDDLSVVLDPIHYQHYLRLVRT